MNKVSALIVDDQESDRYILKRTLRTTKLFTKIFEASSGQEAIDFFETSGEGQGMDPAEFPPILIFLDVNMPILGGLDFLDQFAELRKLRQLTSIVVMMYSSSENARDRERAFSHSFVRGFLTKGAESREQLTEKILSVIA